MTTSTKREGFWVKVPERMLQSDAYRELFPTARNVLIEYHLAWHRATKCRTIKLPSIPFPYSPRSVACERSFRLAMRQLELVGFVNRIKGSAGIATEYSPSSRWKRYVATEAAKLSQEARRQSHEAKRARLPIQSTSITHANSAQAAEPMQNLLAGSCIPCMPPHAKFAQVTHVENAPILRLRKNKENDLDTDRVPNSESKLDERKSILAFPNPNKLPGEFMSALSEFGLSMGDIGPTTARIGPGMPLEQFMSELNWADSMSRELKSPLGQVLEKRLLSICRNHV